MLNIEYQNMIFFSFLVCTRDSLRVHIYGRNAIIKRYAQQVVNMIVIFINTRHTSVIFNTYSDSATISIGHCNHNYCQCFRLYSCTFPVKSLTFRKSSVIFYCFHNPLNYKILLMVSLL